MAFSKRYKSRRHTKRAGKRKNLTEKINGRMKKYEKKIDKIRKNLSNKER